LPVWQEFYLAYRDKGIDVVTVSVDAQGASKVRPYIDSATPTYVTLLDELNELGSLFNFMAVPNCILIDERGVVEYWKYGGFDIRKDSYKNTVLEWAEKSNTDDSPKLNDDESSKSKRKTTADQYFQLGVELYKQGRVEAALEQWKKGSSIDPANWVILKQIWAVEHPEKFYDGSVDYCWQHQQVVNGNC
jgi:tetratricopeptide (TPR) repeat protein